MGFCEGHARAPLVGTLKLLFSEHEFRAKLPFLKRFCQENPDIPSIYTQDGHLSINQKENRYRKL
jgi:hypothetical protein